MKYVFLCKFWCSNIVRSIIIARDVRFNPVILLIIFLPRGVYDNIQCLETYTAMTVDCLAQLCEIILSDPKVYR